MSFLLNRKQVTAISALFLVPMLSVTEPSQAGTSTGGFWSFGNEDSAVHLAADTVFNPAAGFGLEPGSTVKIAKANDGSSYATSDRPFYFSTALPEGNYDVTIKFAPAEGSVTTVKAESRRVMLEAVAPGATKTFTVNVRRPTYGDGQSIHLKKGELHSLNWDDRLTLGFLGKNPAVESIKVEPNPNAVTVFLAGDSTMTDQGAEPYSSWGQSFPRFFKPGIAVANYAESGESLKSFVGANRLAKIMSVIKPGDYLLVQFGHNDQKDKSADAGAYNSYTALLKRFVTEAREHGAKPVLITPVSRRNFKGDKTVNNLGDFPDAVRKLAASENVPLIDLNALSAAFYEALGPDESGKAFALKDHTHHNDYGSYEIAKCVVSGIVSAKLELSKSLVDDWAGFDPAKPDPVDQFAVPAEPAQGQTTKPDGN